MLRHYELLQEQLANLPDNNHMSNQHPSETQRSAIAVGTNYDHLFPTYI
jgi:hypothetical protein